MRSGGLGAAIRNSKGALAPTRAARMRSSRPTPVCTLDEEREGECQHRVRPLTRAILRRCMRAVTTRAERRGGGAGGRARVAREASREGLSCGLRECCGLPRDATILPRGDTGRTAAVFKYRLDMVYAFERG
jgi:hypothetical protein